MNALFYLWWFILMVFIILMVVNIFIVYKKGLIMWWLIIFMSYSYGSESVIIPVPYSNKEACIEAGTMTERNKYKAEGVWGDAPHTYFYCVPQKQQEPTDGDNAMESTL